MKDTITFIDLFAGSTRETRSRADAPVDRRRDTRREPPPARGPRAATSIQRDLMLKRPLVLFGLAATLAAQTNPASVAAHQYRVAHESQILSEFSQLLSIPNIASGKPNIRRNADTIAAALTKRGVAAQLVEIPNANPLVYGELKTPGATRTIALYAHYDGQPLDPKEWAIPPFEPVIRDGRVWARSASDDKAPIVAMLTALDAIRGAGVRLHSNIRFVFEGEEEAGSINLEKILASHRDLFTADVWLICDGPVAQNGRQLVAFGARGVVTVDITLYGARRELHSGHYGNWAPNPAMALTRLLASMKDDSGRVLVDGFYDGIAPLSEVEKRAIAEAPVPDPDLMKELWLGSTEGAPKKLIELLQQPSL